jgi:hypothetical protein
MSPVGTDRSVNVRSLRKDRAKSENVATVQGMSRTSPIKDRVVRFRAPRDVHAFLVLLASERGTTPSAVMRRLIADESKRRAANDNGR